MKLIITPVTEASVEIIESQEIRTIGDGLLIYIGIGKVDIHRSTQKDFLEHIVSKILSLKLFHSEGTNKIDTSILDNAGSILFISNFTLYGNCDKGTKIDFGEGARFDEAKIIYDEMVSIFKSKGISIQTGEFGAKMLIQSENMGPLNYLFEF